MSEFNKIGYLKCARGMKLKTAGFVLAVLYSYSDPDGGNIHPGIKRLAADCCTSESSVSAHLKLLIDRGLIQEEDRGGRSWGGQTWATTYRLCVPSTSENPEVEDGHSTSENLEVDHATQPPELDTQPPELGSQPPEFRPSTSGISAPTKSLPSNKPPSSGAPSAVDVADDLLKIVPSKLRRTQTDRGTIRHAINAALESGVDQDRIKEIAQSVTQSVDRKSSTPQLVSRLNAAVRTKNGRTA
jgi:Helix-turn-helix domain